MSTPATIQRAVRYVRRRGVRGLWFAALGAVGYRRVLMCAREIARPLPPAAEDGEPLAFARLDEPSVAEYVRFRPDADPREVRARLRDGQWCHVSRQGGRIVHASWAVAGRAPIPGLRREFPLAPDDVFVFDEHSAAGHGTRVHGRGVGRGVGRGAGHGEGHDLRLAHYAAVARTLADAGFRRTLHAVLPEDRHAVGFMHRIGARPLGVQGCVVIGPLRRDFSRPAPAGSRG